MPSPKCATERKIPFHQDLQKQKVQAGIIIFVKVPTIDISLQNVNLARQMDLNLYYEIAGSFFTRQDFISTRYQCIIIWNSLFAFLRF